MTDIHIVDGNGNHRVITTRPDEVVVKLRPSLVLDGADWIAVPNEDQTRIGLVGVDDEYREIDYAADEKIVSAPPGANYAWIDEEWVEIPTTRDIASEANVHALKLKIAVPNGEGHNYDETVQGLADATQHFTQRSTQLGIKLTRGTITTDEDAELKRIEDGLAYWQFIDSVTPVIAADENAADPIADDPRWQPPAT